MNLMRFLLGSFGCFPRPYAAFNSPLHLMPGAVGWQGALNGWRKRGEKIEMSDGKEAEEGRLLQGVKKK